jgi:hypothetical protein
VPNDLAIFSPLRGRPNPVLNRRLPEITARAVSSIAPLKIAHPRDEPIDLRRVETFAGAACFRRIYDQARVETNIVGSSITF